MELNQVAQKGLTKWVTTYEPNSESAVTTGICSAIACEMIIRAKGSLWCIGMRL